MLNKGAKKIALLFNPPPVLSLVIMQDIADDIRNNLLDSGVDGNKILWFDQAFLDK